MQPVLPKEKGAAVCRSGPAGSSHATVFPADSAGTGIVGYGFTVSKDELKNWEGLDLSAAIRILEHAGREHPTRNSLPPAVQLQFLIDALCDLSMHDGLTGLVNATIFQAALASELDRSNRTGRPCALLLVDLDRFKDVNDTYGHNVGDAVLREVGAYLKKSIRGMDTAARVGGEEFALILPECSPEDAVRVAARIHRGLNPISIAAGDAVLRVTASAGLAWNDPGSACTPQMLIARADAELYRAKNAGRSRLSHAPLASTRVTAAEHASLVLPRGEEDSYEP